MQQFKTGDKVVALKNIDHAVPSLKGRNGTIILQAGGCNLVRFDAWNGGHGEDGNEWYAGEGELGLVGEAPAAVPTVASDLKVTPGARKVLAYLQKHGDISPLKAMTVLGVGRLASCIHELRTKAGYTITTEIREDDGGHRYGTYYLKQPAVA